MAKEKSYVLTSCKIGLTLNAVQEVKESEDYITLCISPQVDLFLAQSNLASYALRAHDLHRRAFWVQFKKAYAKLLPAASRIFIAQ